LKARGKQQEQLGKQQEQLGRTLTDRSTAGAVDKASNTLVAELRLQAEA
jgi:hypothetical protein